MTRRPDATRDERPADAAETHRAPPGSVRFQRLLRGQSQRRRIDAVLLAGVAVFGLVKLYMLLFATW